MKTIRSLKSLMLLLILAGISSVSLGAVSAEEKRVMMQAFYWDCFDESGNGNWWDYINPKMQELSAAGITEVWLPVPYKGHNNPSMGYDPYDYFDVGEFNQKGRVETYFGSRNELQNLISNMHSHGIKAYADVVYNHNVGGNTEHNPNTNGNSDTFFEPLSRQYQFHYNDFHPSTFQGSDEGTFSTFPDLTHANPWVMTILKKHTLWLVNDIGYDGFRYDWTNGFHPWVIKDLQNHHGKFGVTEYWDGNKNTVLNYLSNIENTAHVFDFPLFYALRDMARDGGGYNLANLQSAGVNSARPDRAVTFIQNHDTDKESEHQIPNDQKMLAYSYILTHQGIPTIFWKDYYNNGLARGTDHNGIGQLIWIRQNKATGSTSNLHASADLYVMQRNGSPGLLMGMNDHGSQSKSATVTTKWANTTLKPYAWSSAVSGNTPACLQTDGSGRTTISVLPRGYVVYAPDDGTNGPTGCANPPPPPPPSTLYVAGSFNNWAPAAMNYTGESQWSLSTSMNAGLQELKFVNTNNWSGDDWGNASGLSGTAKLATGGGANISFNLNSSGTTTVSFNTDSLAYSITGAGGGTAMDITNLGGSITSQYSDWPANEGNVNLIDNSTTTKYLTFHASGWVQYQAPSAYVVTRYTLSSANDFPERDPLNWTLQGSNNGNSWTTIDSQSNQDFFNRFQAREFTFTNSTAYTYYRFNLNNHSGNVLQLSEMELFGK